ncbi:MAG: TolC family protein [Deltaproteobacteria bacterium]|nr:TolC family protein [Deltaproteobacteria bacterium]MBW2381171.1 TolC family protein [Deltaproteobacteria bacterium]
MLHRTLLVPQVLVLCALSGCVRGYDPHVTERPMPSELHADAHAEGEVEPVDVAVPEATDAKHARAVALTEVVKIAMAEPTSVLQAAARLEAASGRVATSDGRLLPGLSTDFRVRYLDGREIGSFGVIQQDVNFARYEPTAAFFYRNNPGAAGTGSKAERRFADAAGYDLKEAQRQAMLQAALSYQDIALTRASMAIATELMQDAERFYDIANARAVAEIASGADVARAEAALAQAQRTEIQARAFWKAASIRLAQLLRWDLAELLTTGDAEIGLQPVVDDASEANLTGEADRARPDVQAAKKRAEGGTLRTKQTWWDLLGPEVDASIGGRLLGTQMSRLAPTLIGYAFIGVSFDFEKGGRIRTAKGNAKALQFQAEATSEQADADIEVAMVNVQAAREAIPPARAEVDAAERSYAIELARFDAGTGSGLEVIQSQNMKARAKLSFIEQILRFNAAQIELAAAIGHLTPELFAP